MILNYLLNKFCPYIIIGFLVFYQFGLERWEPYVIMAMSFVIDKISFKTGYAVAFCEAKNIKLD